MKLSSLIWLLPVALLALVVYVGAAALRGKPNLPEQQPTALTTGVGQFPRTIVEPGGRKIVIPTRPVKIIASDCGPADILAALISPDRMVALPDTVDHYGCALDFYRANSNIPRFMKFESETILAYRPDLVLFTSYREPTVANFLESRGVPVIRFENYKTFDGIRGTIIALGEAVGEEQKAQALAADFDKRLKAVEASVAGRKRPRALTYSNYGKGFAAGVGESQDEIMRRAGADNAAADIHLTGYVNFSFEQMLKLNPDWIVVDGDKGLDSPQAQLLLTQQDLAEMPAIKLRHIAVVPDRYYSSISQYVVDAVEILAPQFNKP